jgi:hypothetical protein
MPFGLTNIPILFQEIINYILYKYLDIFIVAYLDNIFIFLKTLEEYKKYIKKIL